MTARVTQAVFARITGVNRATVHRWIQNGRIEVDAQGLIDPDAEVVRLNTGDGLKTLDAVVPTCPPTITVSPA